MSTTIVANTTPEVIISHARGKAVCPDPVGLTNALSKLESGSIGEIAKVREVLRDHKFTPGCATGDAELSDTEVFQIVLRIIEWVEELGKPAAPTRN